MPAKGVVLGGDTGLGQGIEEGGLADVGQADDSAFEGHGGLSLDMKEAVAACSGTEFQRTN